MSFPRLSLILKHYLQLRILSLLPQRDAVTKNTWIPCIDLNPVQAVHPMRSWRSVSRISPLKPEGFIFLLYLLVTFHSLKWILYTRLGDVLWSAINSWSPDPTVSNTVTTLRSHIGPGLILGVFSASKCRWEVIMAEFEAWQLFLNMNIMFLTGHYVLNLSWSDCLPGRKYGR